MSNEVRRIAARDCLVRKIDTELAREFFQLHHRQGAVKIVKSSACLGLYYLEELVAVVQFAYPSTSEKKRQYTCELLRLAFKTDVRVPGGASKLITYYKRTYSPADIFTYQDATGELTSVYEHCGFTLVSQAKTKQYLVAPGKTLATATRKEALGMAYATRYGPDRILGTKLGEVLDPETGRRKSNRRIFLEDLGWQLEETPGDRVYEWVDPDRTYYVYKITATDSDKYYFGVSHVKKANATVEDCLGDGYWGSGSAASNNKLRNWRTRHRDLIQKEILGRFSRKAHAYEEEKQLVGDRWKSDPLCLNSCPGGHTSAPRTEYPSSVTLRECAVHGLTKHQGLHCFKCFTKALFSLQNCSEHGLTAFRSNSCVRCAVKNRESLKECPTHGETLHQGSACCKCAAQKAFSTGNCPIHGQTSFRGSKCVRCSTSKAISVQHCSIHGESKHRGANCIKCASETLRKIKDCPIHGSTLHQGNTCARCSSERNKELKACPLHGETLHQGDVCLTCRAEAGVSVGVCPIHGSGSFIGSKCRTCVNQATTLMRVCPVHGLTKHQGERCSRCSVARTLAVRECPRHGATKHQGEKCGKCTGERVAHGRFHGEKPKAGCALCIEASS